VKPSHQILEDIVNFPKPTTHKEARHWFGTIEQVTWSYAISDTMTNFRDLQRPKAKWKWTPELREEFKKAKDEIVK